MDSLNFLKFWRNNPTTLTTTAHPHPHLVVETDIESDDDQEDSFFDLELCTLHVHDMKKETDVPSISKRKVLPIEPISNPQSPISLLKSAPSFRIFTFRKRTNTMPNPPHSNKLHVQDFHFHSCSSTPTLSRVNSTRSFGSKIRTQEQPKTERSFHKYLKLIRPFYPRVSKNYAEPIPPSPSVSSSNARQSSWKSRSSPAPLVASRSDDTLLLQHDGIQGAILHCKRSFNSGDSSSTLCGEERSVPCLRNSFEDEHVL
ncbi:hypothetical protein PIB30_026804 [Stylosanthes scabra]|uniref:Membrane-associated kinase regulator 5 n=1 Tax=Stylosanthes scabra TaxID=79078 RepID=A0ABU6Z7B5_9FABA|nr:hypothetical protein [Stylosanthes scabra]